MSEPIPRTRVKALALCCNQIKQHLLRAATIFIAQDISATYPQVVLMNLVLTELVVSTMNRWVGLSGLVAFLNTVEQVVIVWFVKSWVCRAARLEL